LNVFLSWLLLFKSEAFRQQSSSLEKKNRTLEDFKSKEAEEHDKAIEKKIKRLEDEIQNLTKDLSMKNMRYQIVSGLLLLVLNRLLKSPFDGVVVAKIPFQPFGLVGGLTHRGIESEDLTDANFQFVYWLGSLLFRDILNRAFGFQMPQLKMFNQAFANLK
jgi:hypothetical protein